MKLLVITDTTPVLAGYGEGSVVYHEIKALYDGGVLAGVIGNFGGKTLGFGVPEFDNNPNLLGIPRHPFTIDFLTSTYLDEVEFDVVYFNGNGFYNTCRLLDSRTKVIIDHPAHNLDMSIEEFGRLGLRYPFSHMTDPFLLEKFLYPLKHADLVICPSNCSKKYTIERFGVDEKKCIVIPHGCEVPVRSKSKEEKLPRTLTALNVGQLNPDKGHFYLVKAWRELKSANFEGKLILAGGGTHQIPIAFPPAPPDMEALGYVEPNWRLQQLYYDASVYVQPSVTEGFGIVVLEAMAHCRPVVVTNTTGASELVMDGENGFVIPNRDPEAIKEKILFFRANPDEIKRMGANGRAVAEKYPWTSVEKQILEAVRE